MNSQIYERLWSGVFLFIIIIDHNQIINERRTFLLCLVMIWKGWGWQGLALVKLGQVENCILMIWRTWLCQIFGELMNALSKKIYIIK